MKAAAVYDKRSQMEKSYEKFRRARAVTTTPPTTIRLILRGRWLPVRAAVDRAAVGRCSPSHGVAGEHLPVEFTFSDGFLHEIERELDELGWRKRYRTNGVGLLVGYDYGLG